MNINIRSTRRLDFFLMVLSLAIAFALFFCTKVKADTMTEYSEILSGMTDEESELLAKVVAAESQN